MIKVIDVKYDKENDTFIVCYSDGGFFDSARYYKSEAFIEFIDKCMNTQIALNWLIDLNFYGESKNDR